jgi:hypothetical protein
LPDCPACGLPWASAAAGAASAKPPASAIAVILRLQHSNKKSFTLRMDADQLERLDRARGAVPRERFARDAIMLAVNHAEVRAKAPLVPEPGVAYTVNPPEPPKRPKKLTAYRVTSQKDES